MKKIIKIAFALAITALFINVLAYAQNDHLQLEVVEVEQDGTALFERNGHLFAWEPEDGQFFEVGQIYNVVMFDLENTDITDDIIKSVGKRVK